MNVPRVSLNTIANISLILASVAVAAVHIGRYVDEAPATGRQSDEGYEPGDRISVPGVDFAEGKSTLLLFVRSTCPFCTDNMPFYRQLLEKRNTAL